MVPLDELGVDDEAERVADHSHSGPGPGPSTLPRPKYARHHEGGRAELGRVREVKPEQLDAMNAGCE